MYKPGANFEILMDLPNTEVEITLLPKTSYISMVLGKLCLEVIKSLSDVVGLGNMDNSSISPDNALLEFNNWALPQSGKFIIQNTKQRKK